MTRPESGVYPDEAELLAANPIFEWLDRNYLRCDPFAFANLDFQSFALECAREFSVDPNGVFCIGSGAIGLSLNPSKVVAGKLKRFQTTSDLDIALISETHFELAWRNLRVRSHPALSELDGDFLDAINQQRRRFFDGAIVTTRLLPYLEFGQEWLRSQARVKQWVAEAFNREVEVNFWIYRDYWSVRSYTANGLIRCRGAINE